MSEHIHYSFAQRRELLGEDANFNAQLRVQYYQDLLAGKNLDAPLTPELTLEVEFKLAEALDYIAWDKEYDV